MCGREEIATGRTLPRVVSPGTSGDSRPLGPLGLISVIGELFRYAAVGLATNLGAYALYLAITWAGIEPKIAATICFVAAFCAGFALQRSWTFRVARAGRAVVLRYVTAYALAYALSIGGLHVFVDRLGHPHQIVQAILIVVIAAMLYLAQKLWVFAAPRVERVQVS